MKIAREVDSKRQFSQEEVLSSTQIQSFVSQQAKRKNPEAQLVCDKDYEEALATFQNEVLEHIQPKHSVMYDGCNLCIVTSSLHRSWLN